MDPEKLVLKIFTLNQRKSVVSTYWIVPMDECINKHTWEKFGQPIWYMSRRAKLPIYLAFNLCPCASILHIVLRQRACYLFLNHGAVKNKAFVQNPQYLNNFYSKFNKEAPDDLNYEGQISKGKETQRRWNCSPAGQYCISSTEWTAQMEHISVSKCRKYFWKRWEVLMAALT